MTGDYIPPNRKLYLTPDNVPVGRFCRLFQVPDSPAWIGLLDGVVSELMSPDKWRAFGELTPEEAADAWSQMVFEAWDLSGCQTTVPTPYWDEDSEVDDQADSDVQPWYGTVSDPEAPPGELDFVENAAIWLMTGFLAVATWEIGAAPAILFHTIAPRFVLATRRGDLGEIIRILVDGQEAARIDTSSAAPGDVIRTPIVADPDITTGHDIMLVQVS